MKVTEIIENKIQRLPIGYVFTYSDLIEDVSQKEAAIKALNRMVKAGKLAKLTRGKYYKPQRSPFGLLLPDPTQIVKDLLEDNGKITGYLTGYSIYSKLGMTTQISHTIQIGKNTVRPSFKRGIYTISFVLQKNIITRDNVPLLQLLDAIRFIKRIPDTTLEKSCQRLLVLLSALSENDVKQMIRLAMKYPPATRALLGALLDELRTGQDTKGLYVSLNPITVYKFPGVNNILSSASQWNIL